MKGYTKHYGTNTYPSTKDQRHFCPSYLFVRNRNLRRASPIGD